MADRIIEAIRRAETTPVYDITPLLRHNRIVDALGLPRIYNSIAEWDAVEAEWDAVEAELESRFER